MSVEVSSHKLVKLILALGVEILELVKISLDIQTIWSQDVWLPLHQVFTFYSRDLAEGYIGLKLRIEIMDHYLTVVKTWAR